MLNRRSFLRAAPAAGVALTVPAVAIAQAKHPLVRLREIQEEASELMAVHNKMMGGEYELLIRAPYAHHPVFYRRVDDGPLLADDVTGTTAFADWERKKSA
ncbi:hypothetical protein DKP76_13465 [Falsochrobactrum shanghaiense]|uniref:Uncharacterized protein n=1 Tax=Falsochrobactrum shanghaiense TaxID=2201899 RepID=A0A316J6U0_9HYPH|nr:twin-arginine translocation signal domain-containing protein [Falsochrobactrum shanghaiense]PWL17041.1 hypothetical protein DKP76_13465 [Falsochrobactrum shanghaiense]